MSGSYDHEVGTIIKQSLDRFSTRLALDYFVSDRIKFTSNFSLTYTKNNKNYGNNILAKAYKAMPNMAVTRQEYDQARGDYFDTGEYYLMPPAAGKEYEGVLLENNSNLTSYYLSDMVDNGNPVAIANLAWAREIPTRSTPLSRSSISCWVRKMSRRNSTIRLKSISMHLPKTMHPTTPIH